MHMQTDNVFFFLKFKNDVRFFYDNLPISEALSLMKKHGFTAVPVITQEGVYAGSVSEGDFLWFILNNDASEETLENHTVRDLLRPHFMRAALNTISFEELLDLSLHQNYVPIVDDRGIFIGIVTRQTILNYFMDARKPISLDPDALRVDRIDPVRKNRSFY